MRAFSAFWPHEDWSESKKKSTKLSLQFVLGHAECANVLRTGTLAVHADVASFFKYYNVCRLGSPTIIVKFAQSDQCSIVRFLFHM